IALSFVAVTRRLLDCFGLNRLGGVVGFATASAAASSTTTTCAAARRGLLAFGRFDRRGRLDDLIDRRVGIFLVRRRRDLRGGEIWLLVAVVDLVGAGNFHPF